MSEAVKNWYLAQTLDFMREYEERGVIFERSDDGSCRFSTLRGAAFTDSEYAKLHKKFFDYHDYISEILEGRPKAYREYLRLVAINGRRV